MSIIDPVGDMFTRIRNGQMRNLSFVIVPASKFRVKILKARIIEKNHNCKPGEVLNKNFTIACSRNALQVIELQKELQEARDAYADEKYQNSMKMIVF